MLITGLYYKPVIFVCFSFFILLLPVYLPQCLKIAVFLSWYIQNKYCSEVYIIDSCRVNYDNIPLAPVWLLSEYKLCCQ